MSAAINQALVIFLAATGSGSFAKKKKGRLMWAVVAVVVVVALIGSVVAYTVYNNNQNKITDIYFYNWWATDGKIALTKTVAGFHSKYPHYQEVSTLKPGAGGIAARLAILDLIQSGHAPNTFQANFGSDMISYVEAAPHGLNSFVNMTPVAQSMGLMTNAVPSVIAAGMYNGTMLSLPVDTHRASLLYFNPQVLRAHNLSIPTNLTQLLNETATLKADGLTPWMVPGNDNGWDQLNLWESIFLSIAGPKLYDQIPYGTINLSSPTVQNYIYETNQILLQFTSDNYLGASTLTWSEAISHVVSGQAAFQVNGNFYVNYAYDYLNTTTYPAIAPYTNWTNVSLMEMPFPGTANYYNLVIDSVAVPTGPSAKSGLLFAKYFSSYAGQQIFTKWKAVTFYNNVTKDYYNDPSQWYDYQALLSTPSNDFVMSFPGGLFPSVFSSIDTAFTGLTQGGASYLSTWNTTFASQMASEKSQWLSANQMGLGFWGTLSNPLGGYMPPWVNATASTVHQTTAGSSVVHSVTPMTGRQAPSVSIPALAFSSSDNLMTGTSLLKAEVSTPSLKQAFD